MLSCIYENFYLLILWILGFFSDDNEDINYGEINTEPQDVSSGEINTDSQDVSSEPCKILIKLPGPSQLPKYSRPSRPSVSKKKYKNEEETRTIFENIYGVKFDKNYPEWLVNPKTNYLLELDGYNKELNIAFEFNGNQHYDLDDYNKTEKELLYQNYRDGIKYKLCSENGVYLIVVPYKIDERVMKGDKRFKYIKDRLPENVSGYMVENASNYYRRKEMINENIKDPDFIKSLDPRDKKNIDYVLKLEEVINEVTVQ